MLRLFRRPNPFAVTIGTIQALMQTATDRKDMRAVGQLQAALNVINRESLRASR